MLFSYACLEKFISDIILKIENGQCAFSPNGQGQIWPEAAQRWHSVPDPWVEAERETEVPSVLPEASCKLWGIMTSGHRDMPPDDIQF